MSTKKLTKTKKTKPEKRDGRGSVRARKAAQMLLENPGRSKGSILRELGYSAATAKNPNDVFKGKSAQEVLEPFEQQLMEHQAELMVEMRKKHKVAKYQDLVKGLDTVTKHLRLIRGQSTSNDVHLIIAKKREELGHLFGE